MYHLSFTSILLTFVDVSPPMEFPVPEYHAGFLEAPPTFPCDQRTHPLGGAVTPTHSHLPIFPSTLFVASNNFEDVTASFPGLPASYCEGQVSVFPDGLPPFDQVQGGVSQHQAPFGMDFFNYSILLGLMFPADFFVGPPSVEQVQGGSSQYQAPIAMDPLDHSILVSLMFPADFGHPHSTKSTTTEPLQYDPYHPNRPPHPSINPRRSPPPTSEVLRGSTPARQGSAPRNVPVVGQPPGTDIWRLIKVLGEHVHECLWEVDSGEACKFRSNPDQVKKHIRRVHYELR